MTQRKKTARKKAQQSALDKLDSPTIRHWGKPKGDDLGETKPDCTIDMGWGRLMFAHTYTSQKDVAKALCEQDPEKRDIAFYVPDPHVLLALAPTQLFLDPSHTYRLWLDKLDDSKKPPGGFEIREVETLQEAKQLNAIFAARGMITSSPEFILDCLKEDYIQHLVAVEEESGQVIGTVTGVDHEVSFGDSECGCSLWCLAVGPQCSLPGVGQTLVRELARRFRDAGRQYMDLSVMHDNEEAISLYDKMDFIRVPVFCVKRRIPFNEPLFVESEDKHAELNPYAMLIVKEAMRRGVHVDVLDAEEGYFTLSMGGRSITCRESLTELTTAIAMSRCDNKKVTRSILAKAGVEVPAQQMAGKPSEDKDFLKKYKRIVVKPARGEQGAGISVDVQRVRDMKAAIEEAQKHGGDVLLEEFRQGEDLRLIVIDYKLVAAAVRRPPIIVGSGKHTIRKLIEKQSRRREAATGGESKIPIDDETKRCVANAAYSLDDTLPEGTRLTVRKAANLHSGGTIHDVTPHLNSTLIAAAEKAARALEIPVVGLDFIVPNVQEGEYVCIEANERPGLANHEPQPTAERFMDLLFPKTTGIRADQQRGS